jgi:hypothetical protein
VLKQFDIWLLLPTSSSHLEKARQAAQTTTRLMVMFLTESKRKATLGAFGEGIAESEFQRDDV